MAFTEFQRVLFICFGLAFSIIFGLVVTISFIDQHIRYTITRKVASHTVVSGLAEGFDITDEDLNVLTAMALVTYQLGTVNLIVALAMMIPFFANDCNLSITLYMMCVKLVVQLLAILNIRSGLLNDIRSHIPKYLENAYESVEGAQKVPPGKHLHNIEILMLFIGILACLYTRRQNVIQAKEQTKDE